MDPYAKEPLPVPRRALVSRCSCCCNRESSSREDAATAPSRRDSRYMLMLSPSWLKRLTTRPSAVKARPMRIQARKVRSLARWSRAVEPVLRRGASRKRWRNDIVGGHSTSAITHHQEPRRAVAIGSGRECELTGRELLIARTVQVGTRTSVAVDGTVFKTDLVGIR